jgi:uncharacterized membrane protein
MTEPALNKNALRANIIVLRLTRNWLRIAVTIIGIYASLPIVAPVLMKTGVQPVANVLYTLYSPMCHQFAFRSIFLFGEQPFYPRAITQTDYVPYEVYALDLDDVVNAQDAEDFSIDFIMSSRAFRGNEEMGYKIAICARDIAIYVMLFTGGLIYTIPYVRRRLRPLPIWIYLIAGLAPIGFDGFSQLLSYPPFEFWEIRETAPFFRVATGAMFGLMNAWLAFPYIDQSMRETQIQIEQKLAQKGIYP